MAVRLILGQGPRENVLGRGYSMCKAVKGGWGEGQEAGDMAWQSGEGLDMRAQRAHGWGKTGSAHWLPCGRRTGREARERVASNQARGDEVWPRAVL